MKVILISGKTQNGKDTTAGFLRRSLEADGYKVLVAHYGDLLKYICIPDSTGKIQWVEGYMNKHFANQIFENIWKDRYQKTGETFSENLHRVADFCGKTRDEKREFYELMTSDKFFLGGRTMSNSGVGTRLTLNNCFVSPQIPDDLNGIFDTVRLGSLTHQRGGGIGYDFSNLRPSGTPTSNDAVASGPVSFANVFNAQTATICKGTGVGLTWAF